MKLPHLNDLSLGSKVESEFGELEVVSHWGEINDKIYIELKKVVSPIQELIKEENI